ncbi:ATP-binding protein [Balamuthia mandrillaris]
MVLSNEECVGRALVHLHSGLKPFVRECLLTKFGEERWVEAVRQELQPSGAAHMERRTPISESELKLDTHNMLSLIIRMWPSVFQSFLPSPARNLVFELRDTRNRWAHQHSFSQEDTYRCLDSTERLLLLLNSAELAALLSEMRKSYLLVMAETIQREEQQRHQNGAPLPPLAGISKQHSISSSQSSAAASSSASPLFLSTVTSPSLSPTPLVHHQQQYHQVVDLSYCVEMEEMEEEERH